MTTYVRTDFVPEKKSFITKNKLYKVTKKSPNNEGGYIVFDNWSDCYTRFKETAHLNGRDWEIVEMDDDNLPQIGDECEFDNLDDFECPRKGCLKATTSDERFIDEDDIIWEYCRGIKKTIKVVKKASEIIKWCEDHGYIWNEIGMTPPIVLLPNLHWYKLQSCGKKPNEDYIYHEDWLEEKVVD